MARIEFEIQSKTEIAVQLIKWEQNIEDQISTLLEDFIIKVITIKIEKEGQFKKAYIIKMHAYKEAALLLEKYWEGINLPLVLIPYKLIWVAKGDDESEIEEVMQDDYQELSRFSYQNLVLRNTSVSDDQYIAQHAQARGDLRQNQVNAVRKGLKENGRIFLSDDKVCHLNLLILN